MPLKFAGLPNHHNITDNASASEHSQYNEKVRVQT